MRREDAIRRLQARRKDLEALGVVHAWLFGSVAKDAAGPSSDIDIMVELDEGPTGRTQLFSAFEVGGIATELCEILGRPVDLVVRNDAMKPGRRLAHIATSDQLVSAF
ncbi:MAG TPA: nucleotidyltransferase domain-containing protein [Micropepsaceae bacterium]|nr:nucleotidyltransferase domain-containing protein [Micropepsaceae bacterium]